MPSLSILFAQICNKEALNLLESNGKDDLASCGKAVFLLNNSRFYIHSASQSTSISKRKSAIRSGVRLLKKKGLFCGIGMTNAEEIPFPWNEAMGKAIDLQFNMSSSFKGWEIALSLLQTGKLRTEELYEIRPLSAFEAAFADLEKGNAIKILLSPSEE